MFDSARYRSLQAELAAYPQKPHLMVVSKYVSIEDMALAYAAGVRDFGESRAQDLALKAAHFCKFPEPVRWHFIGHVQSNKLSKILPLVSSVHSVDRLSLAERIVALGGAVIKDASLKLFIEVNLSDEPQKHGFAVSDLEGIEACIKIISRCPSLFWAGFMGMSSESAPNPQRQLEFEQLAELKKILAPKYRRSDLMLSMGMSQDYALALAAGSHVIRVGSLLFSK